MPATERPDAYRGPTIPAALGERLRTLLDLEARPETFGDWVDAMARVVAREGLDVDLDALCTTDDSPHRARFDGRVQHYRCVQDAFVVPFLAPDVDRVEIETASPVGGAPIAIAVGPDGVDVEPPTVVLSFGVAADPDPTDDASPALAYGQVCPYGHAFRSAAEYETWADRVDAVTMPVSVPDGLAFARELARAVGAEDDTGVPYGAA